jgi:ParB family chromosome partitioning protein
MRDQEKRARARAITLEDPVPSLDTTPQAPALPASPLPTRTNTAPGALAKFMVDKSETHRENAALKAKLAGFEGASPVRLLDPTLIAPTQWANRIDASFNTPSFVQLKSEIQHAGGNVQPIKVREVRGEDGEPANRFEIVFGHRRHRACLELGLPINAMVVDEISEQELYLEMERENRNREDLSAWEQGSMYARALEAGLFGSIRQLAAALDRDQSQVSKAVVLGKLPPEVVSAFRSPLDLQFRWATDLRNALQKDPDGVLERARSARLLNPRPAPVAVLEMLLGTHTSGGAAAASQNDFLWNDASGRKVATMKFDRKGRATLSIGQALDAAKRKELAQWVDGFLKGATRA